MDFGLDRLIELLERRFGKTPTDIVVAVLGLAAIVYALRLIWLYGVEPVAGVIGDVSGGSVDWGDIASKAGIALAVSLFGGVVFLLVASLIARRTNRRLGEALTRVQNMVDRAKEQWTRVRGLIEEAQGLVKQAGESTKQYTDMYNQVQEALQTAEETNQRADEKISELRKLQAQPPSDKLEEHGRQ
jgi:gas vesicle protein